MCCSRCTEAVCSSNCRGFTLWTICPFFSFFFLSLSSSHFWLFTEANYHVSTLPLICWYAMAIINIAINIALPAAAPVKKTMQRWSLNGASNGGIIVIWYGGGVLTQRADQRPGDDPVVRGGTYGRRGFWWKKSTSLVSSSCHCCNDHHCCCFVNRLFERKWEKMKLFFS